jgi:MFS family permease
MPSSAALAACAFHPSLWLTCVLWTTCGVGTAYNIAANMAFVDVIPNANRGQAFAMVATGMLTGEGVAALLAGAVSTVLRPATVVGGDWVPTPPTCQPMRSRSLQSVVRQSARLSRSS